MPRNLLTTFPFYSRDVETTHKRHWCKQVLQFRQPTQFNRLPPWVIKNPGTGTAQVWCSRQGNGITTLWANITSLLTLDNYTVGADKWLVYNWTNINLVTVFDTTLTAGGGALTGQEFTWATWSAGCRDHQLVVIVGGSTWYSELFTVDAGLTESTFDPSIYGYCFFDFSSNSQVGEVEYNHISYAQRVYIPGEAGTPEYLFNIEGDEDGTRQVNPTFSAVHKLWVLKFSAPEYLADALAAMRIHRQVQATDQFGEVGVVVVQDIAADWSSDCEAIITVKYTRGLFYKRNC